MAKHVDLPVSGALFQTAHPERLPCITTQLRASYCLAQLSSGDRLPSVRALARKLRISPTTALGVYRALETAGFVQGRERSGTFLRTVGREPQRARREVTAFKVVSATARRLRAQKISPVEFTAMLLQYTGSRRRADFRFGFVGSRETLDTMALGLRRRLGFDLPFTWLSPDADTQYHLARDPTIRCLLSTFLFSARASALADMFDLPLLLLRLAPATAMSLQPPEAGRRCIIVRDVDCARGLRRVVCGLSRKQDGCSVCPKVLEDDECEHCGRKDDLEQQRIGIAALDELDRLTYFERTSDTFFASPMAVSEVRRRYGRSKSVVPLLLDLSEETIENLLFHYLSEAGACAASAPQARAFAV